MKSNIALLVLLCGTISSASHTVCSGPTLYYSQTRADMGIQPPDGMKIGETTIVHNRRVLLKTDILYGIYKAPKYSVDLVSEIKVLENTGSMIAGATVSRKMAVLNKHTATTTIEIGREEVICESTWAMVP